MAHRKNTERKAEAVLSPELIEFFRTGKPHGEIFFMEPKKLRKVWDAVKRRFLAEWVKENPAVRPFAFWEFSAPQEPVPGWPEFSAAQRRRLAGTGTPSHEVLCIAPCFDKGIPVSWVDSFDENYYNGRARDIHGNIIPSEYKDGDFSGRAIDFKNPPTYESETAYLQRHGFLTESEKKYLSEHPKLLEPEEIQEEAE